MTSNHHGPYVQGDTRATMGSTEGSEFERMSGTLKSCSQFGLRSAIRPHEAGIASNRKSAKLR